MRKILFFNVFIFLSIVVTGQNNKSVVSSASMIWDMAKVIGGDKFDYELIVPIGGDPHLHEPTPRDARIVEKADLILINGLTFEGWINELIENSGTEGAVSTITEGVDAIRSEKYKNSTDPHAWMSAKNGIIYIENIKDALISLSPEHSQYIENNYENYKKEIEELDSYIENQIKLIPENKRILITSHDAFEYYGQRYGIRLEAIIGISTEAEAQTSDIIRLNKVIQENKVPAIFIESTINPKLIEQIAEDNNISIGGKLFADSIGDENSLAPTYIAMLKHNTDLIVNALTKEYGVREEVKSSSLQSTLLYAVIGLILIGGFVLLALRLNK